MLKMRNHAHSQNMSHQHHSPHHTPQTTEISIRSRTAISSPISVQKAISPSTPKMRLLRGDTRDERAFKGNAENEGNVSSARSSHSHFLHTNTYRNFLMHQYSSTSPLSARDHETRDRIRMQQQVALRDAMRKNHTELDVEARRERHKSARERHRITPVLVNSPHAQYEEPVSMLSTGESPLRLQALLKKASDVDEWIARPPVRRPYTSSGTRNAPQNPHDALRATLASAPSSQQYKRGSVGTLDLGTLRSNRKRRATTASMHQRKRSHAEPVSARYMREQSAIDAEYREVLAERRRRREHMKQVQELYTMKRKQKQLENMQHATPEEQKKALIEHAKRDKAYQDQMDRENQLIEKYRHALSKHLGMHNFGWQRYESKHLLKEFVEDYDHWEKRNVEEFLRLDTDQDGFITHDDLRNSLKRAYTRMDPEEIEEILHYRPDINAEVNLEEFLFIKRQKEEDMEALFNQIDKDGDGEIDAPELQLWLNTQPGLFEENAVDIIYNHTNNFSGKMNLKEFKLLHGMGSKQEYAEFEKKHELHLQLSEFFYGKHGRKENEESQDELANITESDLRKRTFVKKKEKKHPQTFFRLKTRPTHSEIEKLKQLQDEERKKDGEEQEVMTEGMSKIFRGIKKRRPRTAPLPGQGRGRRRSVSSVASRRRSSTAKLRPKTAA